MSRGKVQFFLLLVVLECLLVPGEAGAIAKIKETYKSIKNYFRHGHKPDEHCDQSGEITDNTIDGTTSIPTSTTTDYPRIDIRVGGDDESSTVVNLSTRRLIDPGSNCPEGEKMGVGNKCRKSI